MPCLRHYGGMRVTPMAMLGNLPVLCIDRQATTLLHHACASARPDRGGRTVPVDVDAQARAQDCPGNRQRSTLWRFTDQVGGPFGRRVRRERREASTEDQIPSQVERARVVGRL
jgi:hypothetical protein